MEGYAEEVEGYEEEVEERASRASQEKKGNKI